MSLLRIGLTIGALILLALAVSAVIIVSDRDAPEVFLEDDQAIRAHPDYPVRIASVAELAGQIVVERNLWIAMRDGTRLSASVFRPKEPGVYPVIMAFTAYDKNKGPDRYPKLLRHALKPDFDFGTFVVSPWTS